MPEWIEEKNQWGGVDRYYIDAFGHKVHEGTIDGIPESQYDEFVKRQKESVAEQFRQDALKKQTEKLVICPFRMMQNAASLKCRPDCALHTADGCGMVEDAAPTGGMICPMQNYHCMSACILHTADGCKLQNLNFGGK